MGGARTNDLYPARVLRSDGSLAFAGARVVRYLDGEVAIFAARSHYPEYPEVARGIVEVLRQPGTLTHAGRRRYSLTLPLAETPDPLTVVVSGSCGCGSPLKKFRP